MTRGNVSINANGRVPTGKPPFSVATLRKAIPEHCFKRSLTTSCAYLAADLLLVAVLFGLSQLVDARAPWWVAVIFWPAYWFFQVSAVFSHTHHLISLLERGGHLGRHPSGSRDRTHVIDRTNMHIPCSSIMLLLVTELSLRLQFSLHLLSFGKRH